MAAINAFAIHTIEESQEDKGIYIYGKVTTKDNNEYTGQIRWGKEEAFWFDYFNSSKSKNENLKYLSDDELVTLNKDSRKGNNVWSIGWNNNSYGSDKDHSHVFACQFGDIKSIDVKGGDRVVVNLKNGDQMKLDGGSNDIGAEVQVNDQDFGNIKLDWDNIDKVEFMKTPSNLDNPYGEPLYGIVTTEQGTFEGFVQWDHDERLGKDELNGDTWDGELDIDFDKIKSIKKNYSGCEVTLNSGRTIDLTGSNDVDHDNRGIIVNNPKYGRVDIRWDQFEHVTFVSNTFSNTQHYNDFDGDKALKGSVETKDGEIYEGELVYDLDEQYTLETLNGMHDEIEYFIPFTKVKKITPINREESEVQLKNSTKLILSDKVDVNERNDGILVQQSKNQYKYVPWKEVRLVSFN